MVIKQSRSVGLAGLHPEKRPDHDDSYPAEMAARLEEALSGAGVDHRCEIYPGAAHGWTMTDFPVYNRPAERHWDELVTLFANTFA